eukprot:6669084-Pyramimonas_sp.AAC.1
MRIDEEHGHKASASRHVFADSKPQVSVWPRRRVAYPLVKASGYKTAISDMAERTCRCLQCEQKT